MTKHTTSSEIHVEKKAGPVTIYVGEEETSQADNSGCLVLVVLVILVILAMSANLSQEIPLAASMVYMFCL
jgi:hypothetical protein